MKVLMIAPPILKNEKDPDSWITVPSNGYGGIETVIYALTNGLICLGCKITLIGAPGSNSFNGLSVVRDVQKIDDIKKWIQKNSEFFDIVHDHSGGIIFKANDEINFNYIATHHKTGLSPYPKNTVFLSLAQRKQASGNHSPVIRLPIIFEDYLFNPKKSDYYLYLGRVSEFKGVYESAKICQKMKTKLVVAGPNWEIEYFDKLLNQFKSTIEYVGEVSGFKKINLLSKAKALFVLSRFCIGPWGDLWCEPGATIVGEAAASGTPIISSTNGCLPELVTSEIGINLEEEEIFENDLSKIQTYLPDSYTIQEHAYKKWGHLHIAKIYLDLYKKIIKGYPPSYPSIRTLVNL
jgi:hypothetical protein